MTYIWALSFLGLNCLLLETQALERNLSCPPPAEWVRWWAWKRDSAELGSFPAWPTAPSPTAAWAPLPHLLMLPAEWPRWKKWVERKQRCSTHPLLSPGARLQHYTGYRNEDPLQRPCWGLEIFVFLTCSLFTAFPPIICYSDPSCNYLPAVSHFLIYVSCPSEDIGWYNW